VKCPKCGYVGYEETVRCRHCGYDFSFAPAAAASAVAVGGPLVDLGLEPALDEFRAAERSAPPATDRLGFVDLPAQDPEPVAPDTRRATGSDLFADGPPPARPPLAVRRGPDRPRSRPTTQVVRRSATSLLDVAVPADAPATAADAEVSGPSPILARLAAGLVDLALLAGIAWAVVYFTVRLAGLSMNEVALVPPVPLGAFLLGLILGYLTAFTCCGGQTLGKMAAGLRVVADGGAVPPGTAVLRALVTIAGVSLAGLGVLPALFDGERRALHDRIAGTRVVRA
jgi:uncharacterized RDD family membrane protein YckC